MNIAQNQHYVPKFVLRSFLSDEKKEKVSVYDKHHNRIFVTSIKNIMAEKRFNDFTYDDFAISFEPIACEIENRVLPAYRQVLEKRKLDGSPEQKAALAYFVAFQFVRTKAYREQGRALEEALKAKIEAISGRIDDIEGWKPSNQNAEKKFHFEAILKSLETFAQIIVQKDFLLMEALPGRSFYLADHPVCIANQRDFGPYGNLGLALPGIEIYLPLSANLLLCAWCPSLVAGIRDQHATGIGERRSEALAAFMAREISADQCRTFMQSLQMIEENKRNFIQGFDGGLPISSSEENMDYYNSLQTSRAYRYLISRNSDFKLAERHNKEFPKFRQGLQFTID